MRIHQIAAGIGALLTLASLSRAADVKPLDAKLGLWESTTTHEMEGMPAMPAVPQISQEKLDKMPPAQRAQIEAMMKNRGNLGAPRTTTSKFCMTKESLSRGFNIPENKEASCTSQIVSSSSSKTQIHIDCTPSGGKSAGDVTIERIDGEHIKSNMIMKTTTGERTMTIKMNSSARWIASVCGDVKAYTAQ